MPVLCNTDEKLDFNTEITNSYQIIYIRHGSGIASLGNARMVFIAPTVFCLNENESFVVKETHALSAQSLYFNPVLINSAFTFENIRENGAGLPLTSFQDLLWLKPFIERNSTFHGQFLIGPFAAQKITKLLEAIFEQYLIQPDPEYWPCRGRSFIIELLFFLEQIFSSNESNPVDIIPNSSREMDQIILYLYGNYQRKITIHELTGTFHMNRTTLMKNFNEATGMTIRNFLIQLRIRLACSLIRDTLLPLSEITERIGFTDLTHFSRTFRHYTGYTPSDYRQENCWMLQYYPEYHD